MFDRQKYKKFARMQLKNRWTLPVILTIFSIIIVGLFELPSTFSEINEILKDSDISFKIPNALIFSQDFTPKVTDSVNDLISLIEVLVLSILEFAILHVYLKMSIGPEKVHFDTFLTGLSFAGKAVLAGLWRSLWVFFWTLLFIIPGFVKAIAYSQMFYLLAEYPDLSISKAMNISKEITRGHKADLFMMMLSFIPWAIIAAIPCGLGYIWFIPYFRMSMTNAYHGLLKDAIQTGIITPEDLRN